MGWREERRKSKKFNFMDRVYRCRYNVRYLETGMAVRDWGGGGGGGGGNIIKKRDI